jgi:drug/metabolite transporter (DMT)-like permease
MRTKGAYVAIIAIWSSTPLALVWSVEPGFLFGAFARLATGACVALLLAAVLRRRLPLDRHARQFYIAGGVTTWLTMLLNYWAAQYIPSGWLAVTFGLSPIMTSLLGSMLLDEPKPTLSGLLALVVSVAGLVMIFGHSLSIGPMTFWGLLACAASTVCYAASLVWMKRLGAKLDPFSAMTGTSVVMGVLLAATWLLAGAPVGEISPRAFNSIVYLGTVSSVVGYLMFYELLRTLDATRMAMITVMTPIGALLLGHWLNGEPLNATIWFGTGLVIAGLLWFEFGSTMALLIRRRFAGMPAAETED